MPISTIIHISDIHIRNFKRHDEYEVVFSRLFEKIDSIVDKDTKIVLAGDIVHSKTDMSPELVSMVSKFFSRCADRCDTIIIQGNHDALVNRNRLDALTPIVDSINHPNIHYWKYSGVYRLDGVAFSVFSIADKRDNWVLSKSIPDDVKIALYHGPIHGCLNDQDQVIGGHGISIDLFDGFTLGICGDIHRVQYMNKSKTVGYSSSLICQSYAEHPTKHGILVWDIKNRSSEFIEIPNDYAYVTISLKNGKGVVPANLPPNLRVRIKHESSTPLQIDQFVDRLSKKYNIVELVKLKVSNNNIGSISDDKIFGNSRDISYQNEVITEYLKSIDADVNEDDLANIYELNVLSNRSLNNRSIIRNTVWKPKRMEFSNMFSYGEDNVIDFEQLDGLYGIFSGNASGKSSMISCICFALYDKTPTTSKSGHVLNIDKDSFWCKMQFEMNGTDYFIERNGYKKPDGNVRVDVNFWKYDEFGNEVSLNGEDRDKTNYAIREYVGQYDDFLMTALSTQYDNQSFVEKSQRERKELLYKFLDISIYDELWKIAKEQFREYQVLIRQYETVDLRQQCDNLSMKIDTLQTTAVSLTEEQSKVSKIKQDKTDELVSLNKEYVPISKELNKESIQISIDKTNTNLKTLKSELESIKDSIRKLKSDIRNFKKAIVPVDIDYDSVMANFVSNKERYNEVESLLKSIDIEISHCETKVDRLSAHEYDPNCRFCINNEFVKDAHQAKIVLPELIGRRVRLQIELSHYSGEIVLCELQIGKWRDYQDSIRTLKTMSDNLEVMEERLGNTKYKIKINSDSLKAQYRTMDEYDRNKLQIERNIDIDRSIQKIKEDLSIIDKKDKNVQDKVKQCYAELEKTKKEHEDTLSKLNTYIDYLKKYRIYELYLKSISKEGVPYKILQTVLPVIEHEVNIILNQISDFSVRMETIDEKNIHAYIVYGDQKSWPIELTSGMERFVLSLAFRQALSEITSLPRPNFMAIDEGFGVLDSENLQAIGRLFTYLKSQYDYLLIISHIDSMRDMVDKQIRIDKIDGYSKISV